LLNHQRFQGQVLKIKNCQVVFKVEGRKYFIPADSIETIQFEDVKSKILTKYSDLTNQEKCVKGTMDAEAYHGRAGANFALGILFGPFAIIGCAIDSPRPERGARTMMFSENSDFFYDPMYLNCYSKRARKKAMVNSALGWGTWVLLILLLSS